MTNENKTDKTVILANFNNAIREGKQPVYVIDDDQTGINLSKANVNHIFNLDQLSESIENDSLNFFTESRVGKAADNPVIFLIKNKGDTADNLINRLRRSNVTVYCQSSNRPYSPIMESANVKESIENQYSQNCSTWKRADTFRDRLRTKKKAIPTGFNKLDNIIGGGLREGLYTVGAETSIGKTTFCLNIAEQIARQDQDVIIIALEMSTDELISRSISRLTYQLNESGDKRKPKTALSILNVSDYNSYPDKDLSLINKAFEEYETFSKHLFILESIGKMTPTEIKKAIQDHIDSTGNTPVVIVDYLQLLRNEDKYVNSNDKLKTDVNVLSLKRISRDYGIPIIVVSSFNRSSYNDENPSLSAFKESGAIEYSSDVCIVLQNVRKAQTDDNRLIEAWILKNRNGKKDISQQFEYQTMFNHFQEL